MNKAYDYYIWGDGSYEYIENRAGIGYIVFDKNGKIHTEVKVRYNFENICNSSHIELLWIKHALQFVKDQSLENAVILCDDHSSIRQIRERNIVSVSMFAPIISPLIEEIRLFKSQTNMSDHQFRWINGKKNKAHSLSRQACLLNNVTNLPIIPHKTFRISNLVLSTFKALHLLGATKNEILSSCNELLNKGSSIIMTGQWRIFAFKEWVFITFKNKVTKMFYNDDITNILKQLSINNKQQDKVKAFLETHYQPTSYAQAMS